MCIMTEKEQLIKEIDTFCETYGVSASGFGRGALNNPSFRSELDKSDFSPQLKTVERVRNWIKNQRKTRERKKEPV